MLYYFDITESLLSADMQGEYIQRTTLPMRAAGMGNLFGWLLNLINAVQKILEYNITDKCNGR